MAVRLAHPLSPLIERIEAHFKRLRPKTYADLVESGKAKAYFERLAEYRQERLGELLDRGLNLAEATELVNEVAFPPSEEDEELRDKEYEFLRAADRMPPYPGAKE